MNLRIPLIVSILFLIISLFVKAEYGFYQLLRLVVCGASAYSAYVFFKSGMRFLPWILVLIAIIFNPVFPAHFRRETWQVIDIVTAAVQFAFLFVGISSNGKTEKRARHFLGTGRIKDIPSHPKTLLGIPIAVFIFFY